MSEHAIRQTASDRPGVAQPVPVRDIPDRPWGPGANPKTAAREYLKQHPEFEVDERMDHKLLVSVAPSGYLKRVR